jgi:mono/diheme cytochrome c family protein
MNCYLKGVVTAVAVLSVLAILLIPTGIVSGAFERKRSANVKQVDELFNRNCARCHGADGRGDTPSGHLYKAPDFTEPDWWNKNSAITSTRNLRAVVAKGKAGMPGFGKKLTKSQIHLLVERVRSFRKSERKS